MPPPETTSSSQGKGIRMDMTQLVSLVGVIGLAAAHLFSGRLRFLDGTPRSLWLSFAGGVSVGYVFVHLLPELAEGQEVISEALGERLAFVENHVYLVALLGLAFFYGVHRSTVESRKEQPGAIEAPGGSYAVPRSSRRTASAAAERGEENATSIGIFWMSIGSFAVYNGLIGYLLVDRIDKSFRGLLEFSLAMLLHFVVNDYGLRERHRAAYRRTGRWMLAAAVFFGWVIGLIAEIPQGLIAVLTAFLAGGIVLNVLKEELPDERRSRFWPFAVGAAGYAALLLAL